MPPHAPHESERPVGRPETELPAGPSGDLARALRELRDSCGKPTYVRLQGYTDDVSDKRLSEAARAVPVKWEVIEAYVRACWGYADEHGYAIEGNGDLSRWEQLYRASGGTLTDDQTPTPTPEPPAQAPSEPDSEPAPAPAPAPETDPAAEKVPLGARWSATPHPLPRAFRARRWKRIIVPTLVVVVLGVAILIGVRIASNSPSGSGPSSTSLGSGYSAQQFDPAGREIPSAHVDPPGRRCGDVERDGLRLPTSSTFTNVTPIRSISIEGVSAVVMRGNLAGQLYEWLESYSGIYSGGIQIRWAIATKEWHYCTTNFNPSANLHVVATVAVPGSIDGKIVTYQVCIWRNQPSYTDQCGKLFKINDP